jgi:hypothetical protein
VAVIGTLVYTARAANSAKRSAKVAERALLDLEGPYIFVSSIELASRFIRPQGGILAPHVALKLKNYGRTPATINSIEIRLIISQREAPTDNILDRTIARAISLVLGANETCNPIRSHMDDITDLMISQVNQNNVSARIGVTFVYRDIFDEIPKNKAFWFNYDSELQLFLLESGVVPRRERNRR